MKIGINAAVPLNAGDRATLAKVIADAGFHACRFPLWRGQETAARGWVYALTAMGVEPLPIIDSRSFTPYALTRRSRWPQALRYWQKRFPDLARLQAGNEADVQGSPSSWYLSKEDMVFLIELAQKAWPDAEVIAGGLAGIAFEYLDALIGTGATRAIHGYAQDGETVKRLMAEVVKHTGGVVPIVTEYGYNGADAHENALAHSDMLVSLWELGVQEVFPYCLDATQDAGFGLLNADGSARESWAAVVGAIQNVAGDPPREEEEEEDPWYVALFDNIRDTYRMSPYQFGGSRTEGRDEGPWDCAGFVMEAFDRIGVDIDPSRAQGFDNAQRLAESCEPVPTGTEEPGDLVFFRGTYNAGVNAAGVPNMSHVGIVKGGGVMIDDHARSDGTGPGETVYTAGTWPSHFAGFGRVRR